MSAVVILISGIVGFFAGAAVWTVARWQSGEGAAHSRWRLAVELAVAACYALAAVFVDDILSLVTVWILAVPLLVAALVDLWTRLIYPNLAAMGLLLALILATVEGWSAIGDALVGMLAAAAILGAFLVLTRLLYPDPRSIPLGPGDVVLGAMVGAMVRWPLAITAIFFTVLLAIGIGLGLRLVRGGGWRPTLPYGAILCVGALITLVTRF